MQESAGMIPETLKALESRLGELKAYLEEVGNELATDSEDRAAAFEAVIAADATLASTAGGQ
jgi:hypothetical protein